MKRWLWKVRWWVARPVVLAPVVTIAILDLQNAGGVRDWYESSDWETRIIDVAIWFVVAMAAVTLLEKLASRTKFVADAELRDAIAKCIRDARADLDVVTPYLEPGNVITEALMAARKRGVRVRLVVHSSQLKEPNTRGVLGRLSNSGVEVYHHPHLHAKVCCIEKRAVVSSLNLVKGSLVNSLECGIETTVRSVHEEAQRFVRTNILGSDLIGIAAADSLPEGRGYCIRTGVSIEYNPYRPIEYRQYKQSKGAPEGRYCHACGEEAETSVANPFCVTHAQDPVTSSSF